MMVTLKQKLNTIMELRFASANDAPFYVIQDKENDTIAFQGVISGINFARYIKYIQI